MRGILFGVLVAALVPACAHNAPPPDEKPVDNRPPEEKVIVAEEPGLKVVAEPDDAELTIDGQTYGKVSAITEPLKLKPGIYQVSLKRGGYQTWRAEVAVGEKTEQLRVVMVRQ